MSELTLSTTTAATMDDALDALKDRSVAIEDRAAIYAFAHQVQLRINRVLRAAKDDLITSMERDGLKELGPLSIKATAVDPRYVVNEPGNFEDSTIQDALAGMRRDPFYREYVRHVPDHLEIDVPALIEAMRLGSQPALDLYRELNRRGWRTEEARRLSLSVREASKGRAAA